MLKLYGIRMSRALRSLWALEELGVPYEHVPIDFMTESKTPEFKAINPNGKVPALVDGDVTLFESMAINLYLAKKYDTSGLHPRSLEDEARAVQWSFWGMTEIEPQLLIVLMNRIFLPSNQRDESAARAGEDRLGPALRVLDGALGSSKYLLGDTFTIADLNVASILSSALMARVDFSKTPNVERWMADCTSRSAFVKAQLG